MIIVNLLPKYCEYCGDNPEDLFISFCSEVVDVMDVLLKSKDLCCRTRIKFLFSYISDSWSGSTRVYDIFAKISHLKIFNFEIIYYKENNFKKYKI